MTSKIKGSLITAAFLIGTVTIQAELTSKSKDIIVEQPTDLPELAQHVGLAMELHSLTDGRSFSMSSRGVAVLDSPNGNITTASFFLYPIAYAQG